MAQIEDRKSDFYSCKQSVRDESSAPLYLESAGDLLIRDLAKKQLQTAITLEQQLEVTQNFEKGPEIHPNLLKGIKSLEEFKQEIPDEIDEKASCSQTNRIIHDLEDLKKVTGLSRRELELSLSEKPNSTISKLYHFAVTSKKRSGEKKSLESQLTQHPINHLKEMEEEYFGHLKKKIKKKVEQIGCSEDNNKKSGEICKKKGKKRRRRRKRKGDKQNDQKESKCSQSEKFVDKKDESSSTSALFSEKIGSPEPRTRVSLWDVKDMKKWCEGKEYSCKPQTLYTIKEGKIIKLEEKDCKIGTIT